MSEPKPITQAELLSELDAMRVDPYERRRKPFTPEMDALLIAARKPDAQGRVVMVEHLVKFFKVHYGISSTNTLKRRIRELVDDGRM